MQVQFDYDLGPCMLDVTVTFDVEHDHFGQPEYEVAECEVYDPAHNDVADVLNAVWITDDLDAPMTVLDEIFKIARENI